MLQVIVVLEIHAYDFVPNISIQCLGPVIIVIMGFACICYCFTRINTFYLMLRLMFCFTLKIIVLIYVTFNNNHYH